MGTVVGFLVNQILPSIATIVIIIVINCLTMPGILTNFRNGESEDVDHAILEDGLAERKIGKPCDNGKTVKIFEQIIFLFLLFEVIVILRGSKTIHNLLGFSLCSPLYWVFEWLIFVAALGYF